MVLDQRLNTGKPDTVYLFNHSRNAFLEYKREIVDAKLRELSDGEADVGALKAAFADARKEFRPRVSRAQAIAESSEKAAKPAREEPPEDDMDELVVAGDEPDTDADEDEDDWGEEDED
ncbi:hypothetical protein Thpro_022756 [Acidihalobacter prosperus]|uniref:Uncharacterized protein n=1 Tax=Acidihalobacter prosperus TaxID=160660 RepID=A0A1A6C1R4_9GAMM|nr:hypothetical protein Thpro_022756 [Acidihalobacter prosperus]